MDYDPMLAAMLSQPWSNNACRGYVIYAMENCGFSPNDIRRVVAELYEVFDIRSLEEAQQHFEESSSTLRKALTDFWTLCPEVHIRPKASTFAVLAFAMFQNIL